MNQVKHGEIKHPKTLLRLWIPFHEMKQVLLIVCVGHRGSEKNCLQYSQLDRFGKALHLLMEALEANAEARRTVSKLMELHCVARCRKFGFACQAVGPNSSLASLRFRHDPFLLERGVS